MKQFSLLIAGGLALILLGAGCPTSNSANDQNPTTTNGNNTTTPNTTTTSTTSTPSTNISQLISQLRSSSGINFSQPNQGQLNWNVVNERTLSAQELTAQNVPYSGVSRIESSLRDQGFQVSPVNSSLSEGNVTIAYQKDSAICKIEGEIIGNTQIQNPDDLQNARFNVEVRCGNL